MSTEYSHYSYKSNRRFNKYQPKEITIYAPKTVKYQDEQDYDDYKSYENYDSRSNYQGYKSKSKRYAKDTRTCNHGFHLYTTEFVAKSETKDKDEKKENVKLGDDVSKVMNERSSESDSSSGKSTNIPTETDFSSRKSLDTLEINEGMKENEKVKGTIDEILEQEEEDNVLKTESETEKERVKNENEVGVSQETDESDEEKFSNIDLKVEKKLRENEFDYHSDVFDDLYDDKRKEIIRGEEEEERPAWEDVDTKQILEDIKKGQDFLSLYPQDIKASFKLSSFIENEYKPEEEVEDQQEEEEPIEEGEEEDLNTILALRVLERGFSRPSIEINTTTFNNNNDYSETAKSDNRLPIILESPNYIGCQSAFLPSNTPQYIYNNPQTAHSYRQNGVFTPGTSTPYVNVKPAVFKNFTQDYDVNQWFYTDAEGTIHGPFSSRAMDEWYIQSYFPMDLEINLRETRGFRTLRELVDIVNHGGDFLLNMNEIKNWFNHYEAGTDDIKTDDEEAEMFPPGIPISSKKLRECMSANLMMGQQEKSQKKRLSAFNVYNNSDRVQNSFISRSHSGNGSPLTSGTNSHSFNNSPVNNSFNPSLPFPKNAATIDWKSLINGKPMTMTHH